MASSPNPPDSNRSLELSKINQLDGIDAIVIDAEGRMRYSADLEILTP